VGKKRRGMDGVGRGGLTEVDKFLRISDVFVLLAIPDTNMSCMNTYRFLLLYVK
jgi:hypothetical protein